MMEKVDVVLWGRHATVEWEAAQGGAVIVLSIPDKLQHKVQGRIRFRLFLSRATSARQEVAKGVHVIAWKNKKGKNMPKEEKCYVCGEPAPYNCCHLCHKSVCDAHNANKSYALGGDYVACPEHVTEVNQINAERWKKFRDNFQKDRR